MNTVLGAAVAALSTNKSILSTAAIGLSTGGALFFGGPKVEDLSHQLADACFSKDTSLHTVAKRVVSVTLVAFATFAVVNLGASALAFSWTAPLSLLGAVVGSATYHILSGVPEVPSVEEKVDASNLKGNRLGFLGRDGKEIEVLNNKKNRRSFPLLDSSGNPLEQAVPEDQKARVFTVRDLDGKLSSVIIEDIAVHAIHVSQLLQSRVGTLIEGNKVSVYVHDQKPINWDLWTLAGKKLTETEVLPMCREVSLKMRSLDGSLKDVVVLAGEVYLKDSNIPIYFGEKIGSLNKDGTSATLEDGFVCQVSSRLFKIPMILDIKDMIAPLVLNKNGGMIDVYYLNGALYKKKHIQC